MPKKAKKFKVPEDVMAFIDKALGYKTLIKPSKWWLNTGSSRCNAVFGSRKHGLASGKMYLIAGKSSSGKSAAAAKLVGKAQKQDKDVLCAWVDLENSYDEAHIRRQGAHPSRIQLFETRYGEFKLSKKDKSKLKLDEVEPAEYLLTRVEAWMKIKRRQMGDKCKLMVVFDSTNALSPKEEQKAAYVDSNMRSKSSNAVLLNMLTKRFSQLAIHTNAIIILISQLRTNPAKMFGNPDYVPGGGGKDYFPSSIVWMRRVKDGAIKKGDIQIGVRGLMTNTKNKVGGDSIERKKCGYIIHFFKPKWEFFSAKELDKKKKDKGE